jgi:hypothetical protein
LTLETFVKIIKKFEESQYVKKRLKKIFNIEKNFKIGKKSQKLKKNHKN